MRLIRIGLANINTTVGAVESNLKEVLYSARYLESQNCTVICLQEQVLGGYPAEDLVQWKRFVDGQWEALLRFAKATEMSASVYVLGLAVRNGGHVFNAAAVVHHGEVIGIVPKEKLPTYGVFYEERTFTRGIPGSVTQLNGVPFGDLIFRFPFGTMAVEVCEDIWSPDGPMRRRCYSGAELVVNVSASPWRAGVVGTRREMIATRAADNQATVVYVNQVGGNDSLVFDGGGYVNQNGRMLLEAPRWRRRLGATAVQDVDLDRTVRLRRENSTWRADCISFRTEHDPVHVIDRRPADAIDWDHVCVPVNHESFRYPVPENRSFFIPEGEATSPKDEYFGDLISAMKCGLDFFEKTRGEDPKYGIALSGGKDSVLTLMIVWMHVREKFPLYAELPLRQKLSERISCFSMPTRFNSETTKGISRKLCEELGVSFEEIPIQEAFEHEVAAAKEMAGTEELRGTTEQNIQARIRGERMWNWTNATGGCWVQTGNMSEKAVGYTTIGGDMMGAYSLIGNLPKTVVIALLEWLSERLPQITALKDLLDTKSSAELAEDQEDEDDLMPFPVLDACFTLYAGEKMTPDEVLIVLKQMFPEHEGRLNEWVAKFARLFTRSVFKWVQAPQAVHLGTLDLDRERALQLPVVQKTEWHDKPEE